MTHGEPLSTLQQSDVKVEARPSTKIAGLHQGCLGMTGHRLQVSDLGRKGEIQSGRRVLVGQAVGPEEDIHQPLRDAHRLLRGLAEGLEVGGEWQKQPVRIGSCTFLKEAFPGDHRLILVEEGVRVRLAIRRTMIKAHAGSPLASPK